QRAGYKRVMFGAGPIGLYIFDRGGKITPALKDVRVRKAINYAIDSKAIVDAYLGGTTVGTLTRQQFGPDSDAWDPALNGLYPYNPAKAKELLAEAGYPNGFTVTMPYYPIVGTGVLDTVKAMLGKVGITVKYDQLPSEDVMPALLAGKYSMSLLSQGYVDDWSTMVDQIADTAPFNPFHVQDSHTQRLIHQYQYASDAQRPAIAKQLNAYIVKQAWNNVWAYGMPSILINTKTTKIAHTTYPGYPSALDYKPVS
ncbi:MAG: ABC transporter substrate-binding protein, partial [Trebonia sp.]